MEVFKRVTIAHFCFPDTNFASETYVSHLSHPGKHNKKHCSLARPLGILWGRQCAFISLSALLAKIRRVDFVVNLSTRWSCRGGQWFFKNSGSRKILVEFHGSLSLFFWVVMCVSQSRFYTKVCRSLKTVSGQLAPKTIRPGRLAPESTNFTMFLLFVFYRGFLRTIQYYMFLLFTSYKRFSAVLKLKCFISKWRRRRG